MENAAVELRQGVAGIHAPGMPLWYLKAYRRLGKETFDVQACTALRTTRFKLRFVDGEIPNVFFRGCNIVRARPNVMKIAVILRGDGAEICAKEWEHVAIQASRFREGKVYMSYMAETYARTFILGEGEVGLRLIAQSASAGDTCWWRYDGFPPSVAEMCVDYGDYVRALRKDCERAVWRWFVDGGQKYACNGVDARDWSR